MSGERATISGSHESRSSCSSLAESLHDALLSSARHAQAQKRDARRALSDAKRKHAVELAGMAQQLADARSQLLAQRVPSPERSRGLTPLPAGLLNDDALRFEAKGIGLSGEPDERRMAILLRRREGMFGCEPIFDR